MPSKLSSDCFQQTLITASIKRHITAFCLLSLCNYEQFCWVSIVFLANLHINDKIIKFRRDYIKRAVVNVVASPPLPLKCTWEWHFKVNRACILEGFSRGNAGRDNGTWDSLLAAVAAAFVVSDVKWKLFSKRISGAKLSLNLDGSQVEVTQLRVRFNQKIDICRAATNVKWESYDKNIEKGFNVNANPFNWILVQFRFD